MTQVKVVSDKMQAVYQMNSALLKSHPLRCRKVIDLSTGRIYKSIKEASTANGVPYGKLKSMLYGSMINTTTLNYHEQYRGQIGLRVRKKNIP